MAIERRFEIHRFSNLPVELDPRGNAIQSHALRSLLVEYARRNVTRAEALQVVNSWIISPLSPEEEADLVLLADTIDNAEPTFTPFTDYDPLLQPAVDRFSELDPVLNYLARVNKAQELGDILVLALAGSDGYSTLAEIVGRMGL